MSPPSGIYFGPHSHLNTETNMSGKLTVALNAITDHATICGATVYLLELVRELSQLPQVNLRLIVGKEGKQFLPEDLREFAIELPITASRSHWQLMHQSLIRKALKGIRADIWHLPNTMPVLSQPAATVITIHDLVDLRLRKYGHFRTWYRRVVNFSGARRADHVLTVSEHSKRDIAALLSVPADKITVVYPGVSSRYRPLDKPECARFLRTRYAIAGPFILAPGGLLPNKNVRRLLAAYAGLPRSGSPFLVLTGQADRSTRHSIQKQISELQLGGKVFLTGHVPTEEMPRFYSACQLVAYISLYEGFGLPLLEAMACGAPVVTSTTSSLPEVAGDAAVFVDPYDTSAITRALEQALADHGFRTALIARGFARAREFSWHRTATETMNVYRQAFESHKAKGLRYIPKRNASLPRSTEQSSISIR